jgi:Ca-activated chloride channel family protein
VDITITNNLASVSISATFYNPNSLRVEGTYFFPVEADAVVKDFVMIVNGKEQKGELLEAEKARQIYESIVRRMKDPALLEYVGMKMLKARIFPIEARSEVNVVLKYTQLVKMDAGVYHFAYPLLSAKPNAGTINQLALRINIKSDTPIKLCYSPTHKIDVVRKSDNEISAGFEQSNSVPESNFDIYWTLSKEDVGVTVACFKPEKEDGYCLIALSPKVAVKDVEYVPKDIVFVFDKSGSMAGEKIKQTKSAIKYCLNNLNARDRFSVIAFSTDVETLTPGLVEASKTIVNDTINKIEAMEARGGTAIYDALTKAYEQIKESDRLAIVVFLTDGRPTVGPSDTHTILENVKKVRTPNSRLFVFGAGNDLNTDLLDRLARENRGIQQYVSEKEDIETKVSSFYDKISLPVLTDITISANNIEFFDIYPRPIPDVFAGSQVLLFARYRGNETQMVQIQGKIKKEPVTLTCMANFNGNEQYSFLPQIWAHKKVSFLLEEIRIHGQNKELIDEIVALGKRYGIMTPYTAFLIVDDKDMHARRIIEDTRRSFEMEKAGADGVSFSRKLAEGKLPFDSAPVPASGLMGFKGNEVIGRGGESPQTISELTEQRILRIADKVFYLKSDGFYYDSVFEESMRPEIIEIQAFSDEYFNLLKIHKNIARYLVTNKRIVLYIDGKAYKIIH